MSRGFTEFVLGGLRILRSAAAFIIRLFTVMVLENGPSYQNGPRPFNNGPGPFNNSPLNLTDLTMDLGNGPGKWTWEMDLGNGPDDGPGKWT